jgi:hypothetical protein
MTKRTLVLSTLVLSLFTACSGGSNPGANSSPTASNAAAKLTANQTSYNFPATLVGQVATSPMFELSAAGSGSLTVTSVTSSNPAEFVLADGACVGKTLVVGTSPCQIGVRFQPITPGVRAAQVIVASSDGNTLALDVFGSALASGSSPIDDSGGGGESGGGGGSFPQAPCVPNTTGGIALNVINTTPLLVQVTIAGATRVTAAVPPGAIQTLAIQPGNYTLTGEAPGTPNAVFIPSSWSVVNGCDYLLHLKASTTRP